MLMLITIREMMVFSAIIEQRRSGSVLALFVTIAAITAITADQFRCTGGLGQGANLAADARHKECVALVAHSFNLAQKDRVISAGVFDCNTSIDKAHCASKNGCACGGEVILRMAKVV